MKRSMMLFVFLVMALTVTAQDTPNFNEWFRQKKTQIKYLVQQIAALQVYIGYLKKGYEIVDKGLTTIGNIKDGSFSQDKVYLNSLKEVNPAIKKSPQVNAVLVYQQSIVRAFQHLEDFVADNEYVSPAEKEYIRIVHENMLVECDNSMDELALILTAGRTEMKDDERLLCLDKVHEEMLDKYAFTKSFVSSAGLLAMQRAKEEQDLRSTGKLFSEE